MSILNYFDHSDKKQDKEHFVHLIQIALADGKIDENENRMLHKMGKKFGFTDPEIDKLIESTSITNYIPPYELEKRFEQVYNIMKVVLADGIVDENEMRLANKYASVAGFENNKIPELLSHLIEGIKNNDDADELFASYKKKYRS